jgi:hypothetical protein
MRHLLAAAVVLMASPAFATLKCLTPPGSSRGTAEWSSNRKLIETYLTTSNGTRYTCSPNIKKTSYPNTGKVGSKYFLKENCGPLTIVREVSYRNCLISESAGTSGGLGAQGRFRSDLAKSRCAAGSNIISDTRYELIDKNGQKFQLGTHYGVDTGDVTFSETCTSNTKTKLLTQTWTVGSTSNTISRTIVMEYKAESIRQPSL